MKHRILFFISLLILAGFFTSLFGEELDGFDFLRIDYGGRIAAMGGAFAAGDGDVQSLINPAGFFGSQDRRIVFSYLDYLTDIRSGFLGFQKQLSRRGIWGVTASYLNYGTITRTGIQGEDLGAFTPGDLAIGVSWADTLSRHLRYGATVKYIRSSIDDYSSDAAAVDVGAIYRFPAQMLNIGFTVQNLGKSLHPFIDTSEKLPLAFRAGFSKHLAHLPLMFNADVIRYMYRKSDLVAGLYFAAGGEFTVSDYVLLRFGYNSRGNEQKIGSNAERMAGISFGFGLRLKKILIDYAHSSYGALGDTNYFTMSMAL